MDWREHYVNHKWKGLIRFMNNYNKNPLGQLNSSLYFSPLYIKVCQNYMGFSITSDSLLCV